MEPLRPWKVDQLGTGYHLSSWIEKTTVESADRVIAVSAGMKADILEHYVSTVMPQQLKGMVVASSRLATIRWAASPRLPTSLSYTQAG